jgi:MarR family transcriptional regulator for hemolysin
MERDRISLEALYARTLLPVARKWRQGADRSLAGMGVSASSGWALVMVSRLGDNVRQTDLAAHLDISTPSLVRILDSMVAGELVDREQDGTDKRVSRVRLTEKGRALVTSIEEVFTGIRHDMLVGISDEDLRSAILVAEHLEAGFARERGGR